MKTCKTAKSALIVLFVLSLSTSLLAQSNLVTNGGFEDGMNKWSSFNSKPSKAEFTINTEEAYEGSNCLLAQITVLGENPWSIQVKKADWAVTEGLTYKVILWAKSAISGKKINFTIGKNTAGYDEYAARYGLALTNSWAPYEIIFESPVTTSDDITLALHFTDIGDYYIDHFQVYELIEQVRSAEVNTTGTFITVNFYDNLQEVEENEVIPIIVSNSDNEIKKITSVKLTGSNQLRVNLSDKIRKGEVISVEYIPGSLHSKVGSEIDAFTVKPENHSTLGPSSLGERIFGIENIYPNPASDQFYINTDNIEDNSLLKVLSSDGVLQKTVRLNSSKLQPISISDLPQGYYFIQIISSTGTQVHLNKLIKE